VNLPKITALDLRSEEKKLIATLIALDQESRRLQAAFSQLVRAFEWIDWDEISWEDPRPAAQVQPMERYSWRV
jgi:hypothetical protein